MSPFRVALFARDAQSREGALVPVDRLVGQWTGHSEGQPGKGQVDRQYERVLGLKFIQVRNRSFYPPQGIFWMKSCRGAP